MGSKISWISVPLAVIVFSAICCNAKVIYVDSNAVGSNDGTNWGNAYTFLQDALTVAVSGDEIRVAQGVYTPDSNSINPSGTGDPNESFALKNGIVLQGGYAGLGTVDSNSRDPNQYETILSGDLTGNDIILPTPEELIDELTRADNSFNVIVATDINETVVLDGFFVQGGNGNGSYPISFNGG